MATGNEFAANLADVNVARRLRYGIVCLGLGLVLAVVFERSHASPYLRGLLFVPFFFSANAFFQGASQTCGFSAFAGVRHTGDCRERIADSEELKALRARGLRQIGLSLMAALALTTSFLFSA